MSLETWQYVSTSIQTDQLTDTQYQEYKESGKEAYSVNNSSATRVFLVNWGARAAFLDSLFGYSYLDSGNHINRILPDEHPQIANFFALDGSAEGIGTLGNDQDGLTWTTAKITANYKPVAYNVVEDSDISSEQDRYVTRVMSFGADYLTLQGNLRWVTRSTHDALEARPGKITGNISMQYIWHEVPGQVDNPFVVPNFETITSNFGRINSTVFDPDGAACPVGTVLFLGVDPKMVIPKLQDEVFYWEITMSFMYRNNGTAADSNIAGHNYIFDVANNRWDLVTSDGTASGTPIYQSANLNTLFTIT